jgi:Ca2+-binding RTX toxin-like protein
MRAFRLRPTSLLSLPILLAGLSAIDIGHTSVRSDRYRAEADVRSSLAAQPLAFVENRGQLDDGISFYTQGSSVPVSFTTARAEFSLAAKNGPSVVPRRIAMEFPGAASVEPVGLDRTSTRVSYFKGARASWRTGIPTYSGIVYRDLWPGIDLIFSGDDGGLKYGFVVRPEADPDVIRVAYRGATTLSVTSAGRLQVETAAGTLFEEAPSSYQVVGGRREAVPTSFVPLPRAEVPSYRFRLGAYDGTEPLTIDPEIAYAGYIGGAGTDIARDITIDAAGNAYIAGVTSSLQGTFPAKGGPDATYNGGASDAFVAKLDPSGTLVWASYVGGAEEDAGWGVGVDAGGNVYVVGITYSSQATFPVTVGPDLTYNGAGDAFVAKINATATDLVYSGYVGGAGTEEDFFVGGLGGDVSPAGEFYVAGITYSSQATFPETIGPDVTYNGEGDAFVAKVAASGSGLVYAGYIGGAGPDGGIAIDVDQSGAAYVGGGTYSGNFPTNVGPDLTYNGNGDAFAAKIDPFGAALVYAGFVGGSENDNGQAITADADGAAYLVGNTFSNEATFPTKTGPDTSSNGGGDQFIVKVRPPGSGFAYAGFIGGSDYEVVFAGGLMGVAVDAGGNAYVVGQTHSSQADGFPVKAGPDLTFNGDRDAYIAKVVAAGTGFAYAGYIGGASSEDVGDVAVNGAGDAYVAGATRSSQATFPVRVGPDLSYNGGDSDAFVVKVVGAITRPCTITGTPGDDRLVGTSGPDVICGLGGDDHIRGLRGNDVILAGPGADVAIGGVGNDRVRGGPGPDYLRGDFPNHRPGADILRGNVGPDRLVATDGVSGNDTADGGAGTDACSADAGDVVIGCP